MKKLKKRTKVLIAALIAVMVIYTVIGNIIVSAALVPDFMRKLEAFERVTEQGYSEMVKTDDITENAALAREETKASK